MIPKIVHYCWFGGKNIPADLQNYIDGWHELLPDFEFKCWNEASFDIESSIPFVKEAYQVKKYAFVADYVRMWAMYQYGGLYMDTDVKLLKRLDDYMQRYRFFTAMEYHHDVVRILNITDRLTSDFKRKDLSKPIIDICIESSIFAAEAHHPFIGDCLNYYTDLHFVLKDGRYYDKVIVPVIMALEAEKYGFRYIDDFQSLDEGIQLFPNDYFTHPTLQTENTRALHMAQNSWNPKDWKKYFYDKLSHISWIKELYNSMEHVTVMRCLFDFVQKKVWLDKDR